MDDFLEEQVQGEVQEDLQLSREVDETPPFREDTEAATRAQRQRDYDEMVAGLGLTNPYTNKPLGNFAELEVYSKQYKHEQDRTTAKTQGKSVEEVAEERENKAYIARKKKEDAQREKDSQQAQAQRDFLVKDLDAFIKAHPGADITKVESNEKFRKFAGNRLYKEPISQLYGDFLEVVGDAQRAAVSKAVSKQSRSTGGGIGGESISLSPSQERDLEAWNQENPQLRMTPKEFLGR